MLKLLILLCAVIWLPILFHQMTNRGFHVLLLWLLLAPVALNVIHRPTANPFFPPLRDQEPLIATDEKAEKVLGVKRGGYFSSTVKVSMKDLIEPTRLLFGVFFLVFVLDAITGKPLLRLDKTEIWMGIFSLILIANVILLTRRYTFGLRVATDAFMVPFLAYYTMRRFVSNEVQLRQFTQMICFLGLGLIAIALTEQLVHNGLSIGSFYRLRGPFDHRDLLYIVLAAIFMVALSEMQLATHPLQESMPAMRYVRWVVVGLAPVIIFLTWTRGNWVGFLLGVVVVAFFGRRLLPFAQKLILMSLILFMMPVALVGLQSAVTDEVLEARVAKTSTLFARFAAWEIVIEASLKSPILGMGFNNSRDVLRHRRVSQFEDVKSLTTVHNGFLALYAELGIIGLIAYGAIVVCMIQLGWRLYCTGWPVQARWRGIAVLGILATYYIPALTETALYAPEISHVYVFACIGGIAGAYPAPAAPSALQPPFQTPFRTDGPTTMITGAVAEAKLPRRA